MTLLISTLVIAIEMTASAYATAKALSHVLALSENSVMISSNQLGGLRLLDKMDNAFKGPIADEVMYSATRETLSRRNPSSSTVKIKAAYAVRL